MKLKETEAPAGERCASETCARPAEPGEIYCADCGLERSLYFRDRRWERDAFPVSARPYGARR